MPKSATVVAASAAAAGIIVMQFALLGIFADIASSVILFGIGFLAGKLS